MSSSRRPLRTPARRPRRASPLAGLLARQPWASPVLALSLVVNAGAVGYRLAEGWDWGDCYWMVLITLSTMGFSDPHTQVVHGGGRLVTALLLAPAGGGNDWPAAQWSALAPLVRAKLPDVRLVQATGGTNLIERAAQVASCDVVLSSEPVTTELALLNGSPLVSLDRSAAALPQRQGVQAVADPSGLASLQPAAVLQALGLA